MPEKPNIVLIYPDQFRADSMGCAGHPAVRTPNIDRLAAEGVVFDRCYTNSPLCQPARASLITGGYVHQHGIWKNQGEADRFGPSHVRNIRDAGYHTALVGKTHLYEHRGGDHTSKHIQKLLDWGYVDPHEFTGVVATTSVDSAYTDYLAERGMLATHRRYMTGYYKRLHGGEGDLKPWEEPPCVLPSDAHLDSYTGREAAAWISGYSGAAPFYLQVLFPGPHSPFDSPAEYRARYNPEEMPLGIMEAPAEPIAPYVRRMLGHPDLSSMTEGQKQIMRTFYYGKISLIDDRIGDILRALEERGFLDNTWIIFTSDHGEMLGDHQLVSKSVFYEGAAAVPLVVRPPAGAKPWHCAGLTEQIDVTATLLDIAGARPLPESAGSSLVATVSGGPAAPEAQVVKHAVFSELSSWVMVRDERYKMVVDDGTRETLELYDLQEDANELRNLASDPGLQGVRRDLRAAYLDPLRERSARKPS